MGSCHHNYDKLQDNGDVCVDLHGGRPISVNTLADKAIALGIETLGSIGNSMTKVKDNEDMSVILHGGKSIFIMAPAEEAIPNDMDVSGTISKGQAMILENEGMYAHSQDDNALKLHADSSMPASHIVPEFEVT